MFVRSEAIVWADAESVRSLHPAFVSGEWLGDQLAGDALVLGKQALWVILLSNVLVRFACKSTLSKAAGVLFPNCWREGEASGEISHSPFRSQAPTAG